MNTAEVEIIAIEQHTRQIIVRHMPQSERKLIDAICQYWKDNELPWSITEVLRYERPQQVYYSVRWLQGEAK